MGEVRPDLRNGRSSNRNIYYKRAFDTKNGADLYHKSSLNKLTGNHWWDRLQKMLNYNIHMKISCQLVRKAAEIFVVLSIILPQ